MINQEDFLTTVIAITLYGAATNEYDVKISLVGRFIKKFQNMITSWIFLLFIFSIWGCHKKLKKATHKALFALDVR